MRYETLSPLAFYDYADDRDDWDEYEMMDLILDSLALWIKFPFGTMPYTGRRAYQI